MTMSAQLPKKWKFMLYVACYLLWAALSALGLWLFVQLRLNLIDLAFYLRLEAWTGFIHNFGLLVLGMLWMAFVVVLEAHLQKGVKHNDLWLRAGGVLLVLLILLGLSYAFHALPFG